VPEVPAPDYNPTPPNPPAPAPYVPVNVVNNVLPPIYQSNAPSFDESNTSTKEAQLQITSASTGSTDYLVYPPLGTPPPEPPVPESSIENENEPEPTQNDEPIETGNNQVYQWRQLPQTGSAPNQGPNYSTNAQDQTPIYNNAAPDQGPVYNNAAPNQISNSVSKPTELKTRQNYVPSFVTYSSSYPQPPTPATPPPPPPPVEESSPPPIFYFQGAVKEQASDASQEVEEPVPEVPQTAEEPVVPPQPDSGKYVLENMILKITTTFDSVIYHKIKMFRQ
jgi:hypothetical protein